VWSPHAIALIQPVFMSEWLRGLSRSVGDVADRRPITGSEGELLLAVVARMRQAGQAAALITDADGRVAGVLTAEDLLDRALFTLEPDQPVTAALRRRGSALREQDRIYQALAEMRRQRRNCLPVVDAAGRAIGLVRLEALLGWGVDGALGHLDSVVPTSAAPLRDAKAAQACLAGALLAAGESVTEIIALINVLNDDIMVAVLREALARMAADGWGEPPVPFAALVMGSAGRGESLLQPDQDNGFILADDADCARESVERFFGELAQRFTGGLEQAGFPLCTGNVMATNPLWRKTLQGWQAQVASWVYTRGNQDIMFTDIFFDFRAIFGPRELADALRHHVTAAARDNVPFLAQISWLQHDRASSLDLFGQLIAQDGPEKDAIDLKLRGTKPLVEIVRLLALKNGVEATGTPMRLAALTSAGILASEDAARLSDDMVFLLELLLHHQAARIATHQPPDNCIKPESLGRAQRERLVQVCREIDRRRQRLVADYFPGLA
jgi:signal-transduction protein with cAMP-binding, CBS, and nucleotidyltransferase domain